MQFIMKIVNGLYLGNELVKTYYITRALRVYVPVRVKQVNDGENYHGIRLNNMRRSVRKCVKNCSI